MAFPLYSTKHQVIMRDLCWIRCFCCFSCAFHRKCWFSWRKYHISWKPTKPCQYVCIHVPFTHTCTTKYHQNMIYLVGLPSVLYEWPGQNERSVLNQLFLLFFWCFSVLFMCFSWKVHHFSYKKCHFSWKQTKPCQYVCIHVPFTHTCTTYTTKYHQNIRYI